MPKDYHSEVTDNGTAEKWENNLNCCHIQNSGETGAIWQKTLTRQLDWAHVYDSLSSSCQEACDVKWPPTDSHSPPTDPLVPGNWMFPTGDIRAHFVLDLVDFLKHRETSNINHFWAHSRAELWTHTVIASPSFSSPWEITLFSVPTADLWGQTMSRLEQSDHRFWLCSTMDNDLSSMRNWLSESLLPSETLLRAHRKISKQNVSPPSFPYTHY